MAEANPGPTTDAVPDSEIVPAPVSRFLIHFQIAYRYQERLFLMIIMTA